MPAYIHADESGNFEFSPRSGASRFFLLTTVVINRPRHRTGSARTPPPTGVELHRVNDGISRSQRQAICSRMVFDILSKRDFRIDATIFEKRKAEPADMRNGYAVLQVRLVFAYAASVAARSLPVRQPVGRGGIHRQ